jgi:hypothetical protein
MSYLLIGAVPTLGGSHVTWISSCCCTASTLVGAYGIVTEKNIIFVKNWCHWKNRIFVKIHVTEKIGSLLKFMSLKK